MNKFILLSAIFCSQSFAINEDDYQESDQSNYSFSSMEEDEKFSSRLNKQFAESGGFASQRSQESSVLDDPVFNILYGLNISDNKFFGIEQTSFDVLLFLVHLSSKVSEVAANKIMSNYFGQEWEDFQKRETEAFNMLQTMEYEDMHSDESELDSESENGYNVLDRNNKHLSKPPLKNLSDRAALFLAKKAMNNTRDLLSDSISLKIISGDMHEKSLNDQLEQFKADSSAIGLLLKIDWNNQQLDQLIWEVGSVLSSLEENCKPEYFLLAKILGDIKIVGIKVDSQTPFKILPLGYRLASNILFFDEDDKRNQDQGIYYKFLSDFIQYWPESIKSFEIDAQKFYIFTGNNASFKKAVAWNEFLNSQNPRDVIVSAVKDMPEHIKNDFRSYDSNNLVIFVKSIKPFDQNSSEEDVMSYIPFFIQYDESEFEYLRESVYYGNFAGNIDQHFERLYTPGKKTIFTLDGVQNMFGGLDMMKLDLGVEAQIIKSIDGTASQLVLVEKLDQVDGRVIENANTFDLPNPISANGARVNNVQKVVWPNNSNNLQDDIERAKIDHLLSSGAKDEKMKYLTELEKAEIVEFDKTPSAYIKPDILSGAFRSCCGNILHGDRRIYWGNKMNQGVEALWVFEGEGDILKVDDIITIALNDLDEKVLNEDSRYPILCSHDNLFVATPRSGDKTLFDCVLARQWSMLKYTDEAVIIIVDSTTANPFLKPDVEENLKQQNLPQSQSIQNNVPLSPLELRLAEKEKRDRYLKNLEAAEVEKQYGKKLSLQPYRSNPHVGQLYYYTYLYSRADEVLQLSINSSQAKLLDWIGKDKLSFNKINEWIRTEFSALCNEGLFFGKIKSLKAAKLYGAGSQNLSATTDEELDDKSLYDLAIENNWQVLKYDNTSVIIFVKPIAKPIQLSEEQKAQVARLAELKNREEQLGQLKQAEIIVKEETVKQERDNEQSANPSIKIPDTRPPVVPFGKLYSYSPQDSKADRELYYGSANNQGSSVQRLDHELGIDDFLDVISDVEIGDKLEYAYAVSCSHDILFSTYNKLGGKSIFNFVKERDWKILKYNDESVIIILN